MSVTIKKHNDDRIGVISDTDAYEDILSKCKDTYPSKILPDVPYFVIPAGLVHRLIISDLRNTPTNVKNIVSEFDGDYGHCPNCDAVVSDVAEPHRCRHCNQALVWWR